MNIQEELANAILAAIKRNYSRGARPPFAFLLPDITDSRPQLADKDEIAFLDWHCGAKLAMDTDMAIRHRWAIWLDEMPGQLLYGADSIQRYDGKPPVIKVSNANRLLQIPRLFTR